MRVAKLKLRTKKGTCRYCGCTETNACRIRDFLDDMIVGCSWFTGDQTVCTNPKCISAHRKAKRETA
jgi:hypothetical protein